MRLTGRYCPVESDFDIDFKINEEVEIQEKIISRLKEELSKDDFNKLMIILSKQYIDAIDV